MAAASPGSRRDTGRAWGASELYKAEGVRCPAQGSVRAPQATLLKVTLCLVRGSSSIPSAGAFVICGWVAGLCSELHSTRCM